MENIDIQALFEQLKSDLLSEVDRRNQGVASALTKEMKKLLSDVKPQEQTPTAPAETEDLSKDKLTLKALQQQVEQLKSELTQKEQKALIADKNAAISKAIASAQALNPSALQKLFSLQYGEVLKKEGEQWYLESGETVKSLEQVLADYLASDEGQLFVPPSGVNGSGAQETKAAPVTTQQKLTAAEALNSAFANF